MSQLKFKRNNVKGTLGAVLKNLRDGIRQQSTDFIGNVRGDLVLGMENLSEPAVLAEVQHGFDAAEGNITEAYQSAEVGDELTEAQKEAGALAAMALADPVGYAEAATTPHTSVSTEGLTVFDPIFSGPGGAQDYRLRASMEAFDEQEIKNFLPESIVFNVQAARQTDFAELFFKTVVVSPDQPGLDISVRRALVFNEVRRSLKGDTKDFKKRNLIDAVIDHRILENEAIKAIPVVVSGGADENITKFAVAADIPAYSVTIDGDTFNTAPLRPGVELNLIDLSQRPGLIAAGVMDSTDNLDGRVALEKLYVKVTGANAGGVGVSASSVLPIDVSRLPYTSFVKSVEGNFRKMVLNFSSVDVELKGTTPDLAGSAAAAGTVYLRDPARDSWIVRLNIELAGSVNLETGTLKVSGVSFAIDSVWDVDAEGVLTQITGGGLTALTTELTVAFAGYDLYATRSNANRRVRGLLLDATDEIERFPIAMGSPLSIPAPVASNNDGAHITTLVQAARIRNTNNAVTQMLNYAAMLGSVTMDQDRTRAIPQIEGVGRWLVRPFYEAVNLDLSAQINSVKSHERAADVSAAIVNTIREVAYRMWLQSGYQAALDMLTGGTQEKPILAIGTDPEIAKHIIIHGDTRLTSLALDYRVVTDLDQRIRGKIFLSFVRPGANGADPLSFGTHVWVPELVSSVQVSRGGATTKELQVQPRNRHINNLPVMAVITVTNLKAAVTEQTTAPFTAP